MTEEEARTKWCPFTRAVRHGQDDAANRFPDAPGVDGAKVWMGNTCIASDCMAWRWLDLVHDADQGYCGLAGKP